MMLHGHIILEQNKYTIFFELNVYIQNSWNSSIRFSVNESFDSHVATS